MVIFIITHYKSVSLFLQVAKVEFASRKKAKLKEVLVRLEDHLECVCTSQHHVTEHVEADTGIHTHTHTEWHDLP